MKSKTKKAKKSLDMSTLLRKRWVDPAYRKRLSEDAVTPVKKKRKTPDGVATNDLVFSSYVGNNDDVFPHVMDLFVAKGSTVADVTYGRGVFWRNIPSGSYKLLPSDLMNGIDCRQLPYDDGSVDCVVFDPPYMHTPGKGAHQGHQNFENYYRNNQAQSDFKYHEAVLDLYFGAAREAKRVLRAGGIYVVKCQDEVCANVQRLTHVEIINELATYGFVAEDLFIVMRNGRPGVSRILQQAHARKSHSYFVVFYKPKRKERWKGVPKNRRLIIPNIQKKGRDPELRRKRAETSKKVIAKGIFR